MRTATILVAISGGLAKARWLKWTGDRDLVGPLPRETGVLRSDQANGWTPRPTAAPGVVSESHAVLELLRRASTNNTWINDKTCGWFASTSSSAWTCGSGSSCATNTDGIVACVTGTYSPFFEVCLDYRAFQGGACKNIGLQTGCCQDPSAGACATFLWTGSPTRSMYRCTSQQTVVSMNDQPQFVLDAATRTTPSSSSIPTGSTTPVNSPQPTDSSGGTTTIGLGVVLGAALGGLGLLILIVLLIACCLLKRRKKRRAAKEALKATKEPSEYNIILYKEPSFDRQPTSSHRP